MFCIAIFKNYFHICNRCPQSCVIENVGTKIKIFNFKIKMPNFGLFLVDNLKKLVSYLKSPPSKFYNVKNSA